ncbi:hypothetical protein [Sabulicella glaciei]|uniref:Uncharacterized protein n=1 Tax=Sabulicella glaciei TaxID=2984948 RepID=A0ABT3P1X7_9PROT|nr:hypothetical protein [Roseococcus sp. MDT2-1-1]MCW8088420.1 hypothetical protein [Roseococcus sp. MDT2-1-1]
MRATRSWSVSSAAVEARRGARYIADLTIRVENGEWPNEPLAVFWVPEPVRNESHYLGVLPDRRTGELRFHDASSAAEGTWLGRMADDREVIFSRWRLDWRQSQDGSCWVDGERNYGRGGGGGMRLLLRLVGPTFEVVPPEQCDLV